MYARNEREFVAPSVIAPNIPETSKLYRDVIENTIVKNGPANPVSEITLPLGFPSNLEMGVIEPGQTEWPELSQAARVEDYKLAQPLTVKSGWSSKDLLEKFIAAGFRGVKDAKGQETTFFVNAQGTPYLRKQRLKKDWVI